MQCEISKCIIHIGLTESIQQIHFGFETGELQYDLEFNHKSRIKCAYPM